MSQLKPSLSVCLLSWNHEAYIRQCINSLIAQTDQDFEVVYLDNRSTDNTYELARELLDKSGIRHRTFVNAAPQNIPHNFNFLLEKAEGDFIAPLSTDDWLMPEFVAQKIKAFAQQPETGMVYNGGYIWFEQEQRSEVINTSNFKRGRIYKELLLESDVIFFVGCCYRKAVLEKLNGWDEGLVIEDMDMFIRIAQDYYIDFIEEPLVYYRKMNGSAANDIAFMVRGWEQYYEKYQNLPWINMRRWLGEKYRAYAALAIDRNQKKVAWDLIRKGIKLAPASFNNYRTLLYLLRK